MIQAKNIHKYFGKLHILHGVTLEVKSGEILSIVGPSGAGKSTLLHILGTLEKPNAGTVLYNGQNPFALPASQLSVFRNRHIGFVFQFHHLLPEFSALENVCIPGYISQQPASQVEKYAKQLLDYMQLGQRLHHKPSELSGGEQQRVAVARALINKPQVVLADEPSGNLDSQAAKSLHQLFFSLRNDLKVTFVIVTHNQKLANLADRKLLLQDGTLRDGIN